MLAIGKSARSQVATSVIPTSKRKSRSVKTPEILSKRSREEKEETEPHVEPDRQRRRCQSEQQSEQQPDQTETQQSAEAFKIDPDKLELQEYKFQGVDIGSLFHDFQRRSTRLVNRLEEKASLFNIHSFLAMNYIWDMEHNLPMLSEDIFAAIASQYTCASISISEEEAALCRDLDQELMQTGTIAGRAATSALMDRIVFIYQSISLKLPVRYLSFCEMNEDSFAHSVLDVFFSTIFPVGRSTDFYLSWANRPAQGSKYRRGSPLKPDGTITKAGYELVFLEIKPPRVEKDPAFYLEDYWKLANLCKDAIDLYKGLDVGINTMVALQVFGHEMALYKMTLINGIYHWVQVMIVHLPRSKSDRAKVDRCLEMMLTLKIHLRNVTVEFKYGKTTFLVDPMLAEKNAYPSFPSIYRSHLRNPLIDLPMLVEDVMEGVDAVVSHTRLDHWEDAPQKLLPKGTPLFAQNESDAQIIRARASRMFVLAANPDVVIVNTDARVDDFSGSVIMTKDDTLNAYRAPNATTVAVHFNAVKNAT
ncbi:hypothetical protein EC968_000880 [Mortierella alpina]|nr:hypothetical protein EC968_000880 [Mortierella alpina]